MNISQICENLSIPDVVGPSEVKIVDKIFMGKKEIKLFNPTFLSWAILSYFFWVADFFLVPGRDKYTMWDRRPLGQILFDPNRLYDVLYVH